MLKHIPDSFSPELLKVLMEMGHGDTIVLADANFPATSHAKKLINACGLEIPALLSDILNFFPLDTFVTHPVMLMQARDSEPTPTIWTQYSDIIKRSEESGAFKEFAFFERFTFYKEATEAYAIVSTGTTARYANILLQKGVK